jgi:hypothetical protein
MISRLKRRALQRDCAFGKTEHAFARRLLPPAALPPQARPRAAPYGANRPQGGGQSLGGPAAASATARRAFMARTARRAAGNLPAAFPPQARPRAAPYGANRPQGG